MSRIRTYNYVNVIAKMRSNKAAVNPLCACQGGQPTSASSVSTTGTYLNRLVNDGQTLGGMEHEPRHGERAVSVGHFKRKLRLARVPAG